MKQFFFLFFAALVAGCTTTKYVTVPEVHTDTLKVVQQQKDSIYLRDSIYVYEYAKGDTIFVESRKWLTKYVEKLRTDTVYQSRVDSVAYPIEVVKEVPAELTWWQRVRLHLANILLFFIGAVVVMWLIHKRWGI